MDIDEVETPAGSFSSPPSAALIGHVTRHTGNGKQYVLTGYVWLGATDEWGYLHRAVGEDGPVIARPLTHLMGVRSNGQPRYAHI